MLSKFKNLKQCKTIKNFNLRATEAENWQNKNKLRTNEAESWQKIKNNQIQLEICWFFNKKIECIWLNFTTFREPYIATPSEKTNF